MAAAASRSEDCSHLEFSTQRQGTMLEAIAVATSVGGTVPPTIRPQA